MLSTPRHPPAPKPPAAPPPAFFAMSQVTDPLPAPPPSEATGDTPSAQPVSKGKRPRASVSVIDLTADDEPGCSSRPRHECAVCHGDMVDGRQLATIQNGCGHVFCQPCIANWLQKEKWCPVCRVPAVTVYPLFL